MSETASYPRSALSPLSPSLLNCNAPSLRKRKDSGDKLEERCFQEFTVTLLPEANSKSTYNLVPIAKLERSQLLLSYVDFSLPKTSLPSGSHFHADIPIFTERPSAQGSKLLLARQICNGGLYAVEKIGNGVFVACRLRNWVKEDTFSVPNGAVNDGLLDKLCGHQIQSTTHTRLPTVGGVDDDSEIVRPDPKRQKLGKGALARMSILPKSELPEPVFAQQKYTSEKNEEIASSVCASTGKIPGDLLHASHHANDAVKPGALASQHKQKMRCKAENTEPGSDSSLSADDLLESIQEVLLKTLYTTRTALAYFTKSTLARARAFFRSSPVVSVSELADFYRSRIISSKKMDLKYRETIPKIIKNAPFQDNQLELGSDMRPVSVKRKRSRGKRINKDGLYTGEEAFVRSWLNREEIEKETVLSGSCGLEVQDLLSELRNRETQLQIILILEILTLESSVQAEREAGLLEVPLKKGPGDDETRSIQTKTPPERDKKRDLKADLDVLIDRMCIYQSVSMRDATTIDGTSSKNGESGDGVKDKLRDYCCNVLLPFYFHKAPDLVKEISCKLGGPDVSTKRPTNTSRKISFSRTNTEAQDNAHRRYVPRPTLERVLSEERNGRHFSAPLLKRSATTPLDNGRRQDSAELSQRPCQRGSLQKSHSFTNREIDLVANTKAQDAKAKKLANLAKQKEELNAAINALKRPNRSLPGMQIMAESERRCAEQDIAKRNFLNTSNFDPNSAVQITATPKKGIISGNATSTRRNLNGNATHPLKDRWKKALEEPSILSSAVRSKDHGPSQSSDEISDASIARPAVYSAVYQTPTRSSCKTLNPLTFSADVYTFQHPDLPATTYVAPDLSVIQATPSTTRLRPNREKLAQVESTPLRMTKSQKPVMFTPLKQTVVKVEHIFRDAPVVSEEAGKAMERVMNPHGSKDASIYDSLGWDDDVDEFL